MSSAATAPVTGNLHDVPNARLLNTPRHKYVRDGVWVVTIEKKYCNKFSPFQVVLVLKLVQAEALLVPSLSPGGGRHLAQQAHHPVHHPTSRLLQGDAALQRLLRVFYGVLGVPDDVAARRGGGEGGRA